MVSPSKQASPPPGRARPEALYPLFAPLQSLPGVGKAVERRLAQLLGRETPRCIDLLALVPTGMIDPRPLASLADVAEATMATLAFTVQEHRPPAGAGRPWRIIGTAAGEPVELAFFNSDGGWLKQRFAIGAGFRIHGRLGRWGDRWQIAHPEILADEPPTTALALYPLVEGLGHVRLRKLVAAALPRIPALAEWLDADICARHGLPDLRGAFRLLHAPPPDDAAGIDSPARRRLALDELFASQLALQLSRRRREAEGGRAVRGDGSLGRALLASLPFSPTGAQRRAVAEILGDMAAPAPMLRLLQGDVGSGKTLVALLAMLAALEAGHQAALMVPSEALAGQHATTLARLLAPLRIEPLLLTGSTTGGRRTAARAAIASGEARLVVGTHALFQEGVAFADLALAVIDEQHRFGVHQRLDLRAKGRAVDLLLMSATPIPRSLLLAREGGIASSILDEKPAGRLPITTRVLPSTRLDALLEATARALGAGQRIFWVCPLIDERGPPGGEAAATVRFEALRARFGAAVGLIHGRMGAAEKTAAIAALAQGSIRILVATSVIEVGIDLPEVAIIVVEQAERFGLAQLHQLRGRVGRGRQPSSCVLLYEPPLDQGARERLEVLRRTDDGFAIAEADLVLRGGGELHGTRQSGAAAFRFVRMPEDEPLLAVAHEAASALLRRDPRLAGDAGRAARMLLHLLEWPEPIGFLDAG